MKVLQNRTPPGTAAGSGVLLLLVLLTASGCSGGPDAGAGTAAGEGIAPLRVNVGRPAPADGYAAVSTYSGRVETARTAALGFELGGRIEQILVDEGDTVAEGAPLARLDTARLEAARRELGAALAQARSRHALSEKTFARMQEARGYRGVSTQALDQARDDRDSAEAALALAQARLERLDVDLARSVLHAPFAGTVARRMQDEGTVVEAGAPLLLLEETGRLRARIGIAGDALTTLVPGARHRLTARDGHEVQARIEAILPVRDPVARTVDVLFALLPPAADAQALRAGDLLTLRLREFRPEPGFWLPLAALTEGERGLWSVLIAARAAQEPPQGMADAAYRIERRLVEVQYHDADRVYVTGGIGRDELLVVDGTHRVVAGQRVQPVGDAVADAAAVDRSVHGTSATPPPPAGRGRGSPSGTRGGSPRGGR